MASLGELSNNLWLIDCGIRLIFVSRRLEDGFMLSGLLLYSVWLICTFFFRLIVMSRKSAYFRFVFLSVKSCILFLKNYDFFLDLYVYSFLGL